MTELSQRGFEVIGLEENQVCDSHERPRNAKGEQPLLIVHPGSESLTDQVISLILIWKNEEGHYIIFPDSFLSTTSTRDAHQSNKLIIPSTNVVKLKKLLRFRCGVTQIKNEIQSKLDLKYKRAKMDYDPAKNNFGIRICFENKGTEEIYDCWNLFSLSHTHDKHEKEIASNIIKNPKKRKSRSTRSSKRRRKEKSELFDEEEEGEHPELEHEVDTDVIQEIQTHCEERSSPLSFLGSGSELESSNDNPNYPVDGSYTQLPWNQTQIPWNQTQIPWNQTWNQTQLPWNQTQLPWNQTQLPLHSNIMGYFQNALPSEFDSLYFAPSISSNFLIFESADPLILNSG